MLSDQAKLEVMGLALRERQARWIIPALLGYSERAPRPRPQTSGKYIWYAVAGSVRNTPGRLARIW